MVEFERAGLQLLNSKNGVRPTERNSALGATVNGHTWPSSTPVADFEARVSPRHLEVRTLEDEPGSLSPELTAEVHNRIAQLERGEVKAVPWSEVEAQLRRTLERQGRRPAACGLTLARGERARLLRRSGLA